MYWGKKNNPANIVVTRLSERFVLIGAVFIPFRNGHKVFP